MSIDPKQEVARLVEANGLSGTARTLGVSVSYLCNMMKGRADPGPLVLNALGLEKVVTYRQRQDGQANG